MQTKYDRLGFALLLAFCVWAITITQAKNGISAAFIDPEQAPTLLIYGLGSLGSYISIERLMNGQ